jgi:hypothetical protein
LADRKAVNFNLALTPHFNMPITCSVNFLYIWCRNLIYRLLRYKKLEIPLEFFGMIHLKDVLVVVADRWLNNKNLKCMDTIKSIFINLSLGSALALLGNLLVTVSFGIGGELTEIIC